ncbi:MAG: N-acetylneuraminate synthase family protein [bacterium]
MTSYNRIQISDRWIGSGEPLYIIAEIGVNHEGSMDKAKEMIRLAKAGGANAVKFQSYRAETLASKHSPSYWDLKKEPITSQYELFKKYDKFGSDKFKELANYCNKIGIDFLSTPFDDEAIEFLDPLVSFFKIASADLTNTPFIRKIAAKGKPIVLSTGASTLEEINQAVDTIKNTGCKDIVLLHCILNYPTKNKNAHLGMITGLRNAFPDLVIGYSDHTLPDKDMTPLITAYLLGARIIEKHFTYDKTLLGNDHYHAMDINDLKRFVQRLKYVDELIGSDITKKPVSSEEISRKNARRSIVLKNSIFANTIINESMIIYKRPGTGISPFYWDEVIGKKVKIDLEEDHILQWSDLESIE